MDNWANGSYPARIFLQPIAAPSILGLYGLAVLTFAVASRLAGWWGPKDHIVAFQSLAPFAFFFGGLAQFLAGTWAYKVRRSDYRQARDVGRLSEEQSNKLVG